MSKILLIEDDRSIIESITDTLKFHHYQVVTATDGIKGLELFKQVSPDLVILDIMLPGVDGYQVLGKIREKNKNTSCILLTAKSRESDKLLGFELGADDYLTKPFSVAELVARIKAVLKRNQKPPRSQDIYTLDNIIINLKNFSITRNKKILPLSPRELQILKLFLQSPNEMISRDRIIDLVWGDEYDPSPRTIDNFILKLRTKLEKDPKNPRHLITIHGAGYKFVF